MKKIFLLIPVVFILGACSHGNCKQNTTDKSKSSKIDEVSMAQPTSALERVKVYKADGSLQCGQGKAIAVAEMQKELKGIKVYSTANKNDGMIRIQVCGAPTGNSNIYEIDRKDLDAALKAGFKEWTFE